ncbi:MAG: hypothetical protein ACKO6K_10450 [Chitinophagaceae bacterium]
MLNGKLLTYYFGFIGLGLLITSPGASRAQTTGGSGYQLDAYDIRGKVFTSVENEEEGSPYYNPQWVKGMVKFSTGHWVKQIDLRFNLIDQQLYFRKNEQMYLFVDTVREFLLSPSETPGQSLRMFRSGYPLNGKFGPATFYEVLAEGSRIQLVRLLLRKMLVQNNYAEGTRKVYKDANLLFWYHPSSGKWVNADHQAEELVQAFPEFAATVADYVRSHRTKLRKEEELAELAVYLNQH